MSEKKIKDNRNSNLHSTLNQLIQQAQNLEDKGKLEYAIDTYDAIISLVQNNNLDIDVTHWRKKKAIIISKMKNSQNDKNDNEMLSSEDKKSFSSTEINSLEDYFSLLKIANTLESSNKVKSQNLLKKCLSILIENESEFQMKYPLRKQEKQILKNRIEYMEKNV